MSVSPKELSGTPTVSTPAQRDELPYRLRQQSLLGEFGRTALQTRNLHEILQRATELSAEGLEAPFAKVLEYIPNENRLLVQAGIGWGPNTIGAVSLGSDIESPAGYAFHTGQMVLSNHLQEETRFRTPELLAAHGIRRAINVLIELGGEGTVPFGVLEVDSPDPGQFDRADADFLAGFAGLLGIAIERQHADAKLNAANEYQILLTREMSHRVKNSLTSVVGLLRVQARGAESEEVQTALEDAASRVGAIAQVHDHLWRSSQIGVVELSDFVGELCKKLHDAAPGHSVICHADKMMISADRAIPLGLLINELVTNAIKYAYPNDPGPVHVTARASGETLQVAISDEGIGLPDDFNIEQPRRSLGFKVINGLIRQLNGKVVLETGRFKGSHFQIEIPIHETQPNSSAEG
jgi:two-component sensor histidine kinase